MGRRSLILRRSNWLPPPSAKQAVSARDRAFSLALAANWEKLAEEAEAPKFRLWAMVWATRFSNCKALTVAAALP